MEWQPIKTAPVDGTRVLVCGPYYAPEAAFFGHYHPNAKGKAQWRSVNGGGTRLVATHWMPLPDPPKA